VKWIILCHIVTYLLLMICAEFDRNLLTNLKVIVKNGLLSVDTVY